MKYFSGFCLKDEEELFNQYLEKKDLVVAGFSFGAQKALKYALKHKVTKLQLFSPAYFQYPQKIIQLNLNAFKKDKNSYIKNFLQKAGLKNEKYIQDCTFEELKELFEFDWEIIKEVKCKIEVFIGQNDKIINPIKAKEFFKKYGIVYFIKEANHFLRRDFE
jgi:esterase/lipase